MDVLLLRHGETAGNQAHRYIGVTDEELCPEGRARLMKGSGLLPAVSALWLSPMRRCIQSAELLFPNQPYRLCEDLRECNFGLFEGKTWAELSCIDAYKDWAENAGKDFTFPGGERYSDFLRRSCAAFRSILEEAFAQNTTSLGILAHGGTIMAIMETFALPARDFYDWQPGCGCGYLLYAKENSFIITLKQKIEL